MSGSSRETTRQKMIGMMYLVLTALLALNVSSSVLDGFTIVDNSLHTSIESSVTRNKALYAELQDMFKKNPDEILKWKEKADLAKKKSDNLYEYIERFKVDLIKLTDNKNANDSAYVRQILYKDNLEAASEYALTRGNGKILKQKLDNYCKYMVELSASNPIKQKMYQSMFATTKTLDGKPWDLALFEMMPVSAVIAILTKYQNDIRSSETEIIQYLKTQTDASGDPVNKMEAMVIPDSRYVNRGGQYSAQIVISAADSTRIPEYFVGGTSVPKGLYVVNCNKPGIFNYSGEVKLKGKNGATRSFPFKSDYTVGEQSASIINEDMNILYRGIDNKFNISIPGVTMENISARVTGGTVQKVGGKFSIRVNQDGNINIVIFAKYNGKDLPMGDGTFRIKYLPDPKSFLRFTDAGGNIRLVQDASLTKQLLKGKNVSLVATYGQDQIIKANFNVTSFTLLTVFGSVNATGSHLSDEQLADIDKLGSGGIFTLKNIKAVGPDGKERILGLIQIKV
jgi:gliding motility-associated protein GldM